MKMQLRGLSDVLDAAVLGPFRSGGRHGTDALLGALILPAGRGRTPNLRFEFPATCPSAILAAGSQRVPLYAP